MSALTSLSMRQLQDEVGVERLQKIENVLAVIDKSYVDGQIFGSKTLLEKVLVSFGGAEKLADAGFRKRLYSHLSPELLRKMGFAAGINAETLSYESLLEQLLALGWSNTAVCEAILDCLELPRALAPKPKSTYPRVSVVDPPLTPYFQLKDYQSDVFFKAMHQLEAPLSRFVVQMPTGSGKTRTAMEIVASTLNLYQGIIVWVAHAEELCEQAYRTFVEVWQHIGRSPVKVVRLFGKTSNTPVEIVGPTFVVASFQRLHSQFEGKEIAPDWCQKDLIHLVIVDEAHKVVAPTYKRATKALFGKDTRCIGLTATPGRGVSNLDGNDELAAFFFEKMVTFDSGLDDPIDYLRIKGVLAHAEYAPLRSNIGFALTDRELAALEKFFDFPRELLERVGANDLRNAEIMKRLQQELSRGAQIIFFGCSVDHSRFICSTLTYLGYKAAHIDGETPKERRVEYVRAFKSGEMNVLCNFEVLSTGFDAPKTDVVFISRPTKSLVLYSQMIGRGLRGPAVGGKANCRIIDVLDNITGFADPGGLYSYFSGYWSEQ